MRFVHVAGKSEFTSKIAVSPIYAQQTGACLYSIIEGMRQKDFGLHTLGAADCNIRKYEELFIDPVKGMLFIDSGGYSIIVGYVSPENIHHFINCYNTIMVLRRDFYSYIFSLDIPFSIKYKKLNTTSALLIYNREALATAKDILEKYPEIRDKYYFVWHFKMATQYMVWRQLYQELGLASVVRNWALGGMVGMRGLTRINFSPFTAMAFRCLLDYLTQRLSPHPFRLHYLGMYIPYDRFQIALLEQLFQDYLQNYLGPVARVEMSYDSINYVHTARMNASAKPWFDYRDDGLAWYPKVMDVPQELLRRVYGEGDILEVVREQVERRSRGARLIDCNAFGPLSVHSNLCLDRLFEWVIQEYELVKLITDSGTPTVLDVHLHKILNDLEAKYPQAFTKRMLKSIENNVDITHIFHHRWFMGKRDYETHDDYMARFIDMIGFPDKIDEPEQPTTLTKSEEV